MAAELPVVSAFLVGLLGSVHCIGMCGGIVGALTMGLPAATRSSPWRMAPYLLAYNGGRIASYAMAGALAGGVGAGLFSFFPSEQALAVGRVIAGLFMVLLGLYVGGFWPALGALEKIGAMLWRAIEPWGRRFLPVSGPLHALGLGLVWGWLPCGLVYAALALALAAGNVVEGAARMTAFGVGTLPMLLAMGATARWLGNVVRLVWVRRVAGILILFFGVYTLTAPGGHAGHGGEQAGHDHSAHHQNY